MVALLLAAFPAYAQTAPRQVNISSGSAPGWVPSVAQERDVAAATDAWFAALERGDYAGAYAMLAPANRLQSPEQFAREHAASRDQAGAPRDRTILMVTWTRDPADAPFPGVYAAVDVSERHANVDRQCGYLMWYQKPEGGPFRLMRIETALMTNAVAAKIEAEKGRAEVDRAWAQTSSYCPNYPR